MPRCRPFKLIDAMIMVAAAALGMSSMLPVWDRYRLTWIDLEQPPTWRDWVQIAHAGLNSALLMLVVAYICMRLIPPRPPVSDLIRQPGVLFLGLLIGIMFLAPGLSAYIPEAAWRHIIATLALGLSWAAACRRYRSHAEPGWIEVLGRTIGVGVVVNFAASYAQLFLAF